MANIKLSDPIPETRLTLERIRMGASKVIGRSLVDSMEFRRNEIPGLDGWIFELSMQCLASKLADDKYTARFYYKVPATWFQHLKKSHAPKWFKNRYPVRYEDKKATKTVHFKRYETYPQANIAIPKDQRTIEMIGLERPIRDIVEEY